MPVAFPVPLWLLGAGAALLAGGSVILLRAIRREDHLNARLLGVQHSNAIVAEVAPPTERPRLPLHILVRIGEGLARHGLLPAKTRADMALALRNAGFGSAASLSLFIGAKLLLLPLAPLLCLAMLGGTVSTAFGYGALAASAALGLLLPDFVVKRLRIRHLKQVDNGLADALDLLVICSEAGLGLEPALERIAREMTFVHPALASELGYTINQFRVAADRRTAIASLGRRTGLESLKRIGMAMNQSMQYGTPLSRVFRTLSIEMRHEQLSRFEARAARLPVLLTVPLIVFILPCIFIVVGGPAALQVITVMTQQ